MTAVWGIHNDTLGSELFEEGFVSIGWDALPDLRSIGLDRDRLKIALADAYPERKPGAFAVWAGILHRFGVEMAPGDLVVAPYKKESTINIGVVTGPYEFHAGATTHRHRRKVEWKRTGLSRTMFSQAALYELGAFLTVFGIRKHDDEFRAALQAKTDTEAAVARAVVRAAPGDAEFEAAVDEPRAGRIHRHTRDFVLERLRRDLSHEEFEQFTADLLRALGYVARVTAYSQDGGVDVIAHRDPLGVEPPLIKVQCKHQTTTVGAPEVQQLVGTQAHGELSLFVTLGGYSREALSIERVRQGLRLITGEELIDLVLQQYDHLSQTWRQRIPLTPVLVVDDAADL
ncbi:restriction endonuclease [Vallicoccus soli]|uniref:Restriction endonuclease n=1 Tax=Vallicoccus soli TaxID=2339232 RepID=A0A3A3ZHK8_9ACTN|nr:restriction endonuclease [Vallicoccus soli]RJK94756.1 restriction endonuclease [Vallicoccus soli]